MEGPFAEKSPEGQLTLRNLPAFYIQCLLTLPEILDREEGDIRDALFPNAFQQAPELRKDWEKYARPDLLHLFGDRVEIIREDLRNFGINPTTLAFNLAIPETHVSAWLASLNAARLLLGDDYGITAADMEREPILDESPEDKEIALLQISILGHVQHLMLEPRGEFGMGGMEFELGEDPEEGVGDLPEEDPGEAPGEEDGGDAEGEA